MPIVEGQKVLVEAEVVAVDEENKFAMCLIQEINKDHKSLWKIPLSVIHPTEGESS